MRRAVLTLGVLCSLGTGCLGGERDSSPTTPAFSEIAEEVRRVPLEDSEVALIGNLRGLAPRPNGNLVVLDPMTMRVLEFGPAGDLLRWKGRPGDGPGEFRNPIAVALLRDGRLVVAETGRITLLSQELEFEENVPVENSSPFRGLFLSEEGLILGAQSHRHEGLVFSFLDLGTGETRNPFVQQHPDLRTVPYWNAFFTTDLTEFQGRFVVSHNMVYPILLYDRGGALVDSLDSPPESWIEAPRPERGEFASPSAQRGFREWQRGFTLMAGVYAVQDSWLVVPHRVFPEGSDDPEYLLDIYDEGFIKRYTDVRSPGRPILGGDCLWVITAEPPSPWTLSCFIVS